PTGNVFKQEEGKTSYYSYRNGKYVADIGAQIPTELRNWTYFDWGTVDWHDQLHRNDSDIPDGKFWPQDAKIKKVIYLSARNTPVVTAVICSTMPEPPENFPFPT